MLSDETVGKFRDIGFELRGRCATYLTVSRSVNTKTGAVTATEGEYSVVVLPAGVRGSKSVDARFRVRTCELPETGPAIGHQLVYKDHTYTVTNWFTDQSQYVVDLVCREA